MPPVSLTPAAVVRRGEPTTCSCDSPLACPTPASVGKTALQSDRRDSFTWSSAAPCVVRHQTPRPQREKTAPSSCPPSWRHSRSGYGHPNMRSRWSLVGSARSTAKPSRPLRAGASASIANEIVLTPVTAKDLQPVHLLGFASHGRLESLTAVLGPSHPSIWSDARSERHRQTAAWRRRAMLAW